MQAHHEGVRRKQTRNQRAHVARVNRWVNKEGKGEQSEDSYDDIMWLGGA